MKKVDISCKASIGFRSTGDKKLDKKILLQIQRWIKSVIQDGPVYLVDDGCEYATFTPKVKSIKLRVRDER